MSRRFFKETATCQAPTPTPASQPANLSHFDRLNKRISKRQLLNFSLAAPTVLLLAACGGGGSSSDTTPPTLVSITQGANAVAASGGIYSLNQNLGESKTYLLTFSKKLGSASYAITGLPTGLTATFNAVDSAQLAYNLAVSSTVALNLGGQASKTFDIAPQVSDAAGNTATINLKVVVTHMDTPGVVTITGPALSGSGPITLNLTATDADGIASWVLTSQRTRNTGVVDPAVIEQTSLGIPPTMTTLTISGNVPNTFLYLLKIIDNYGHEATGSWTVTRN